MSTSDSDYSVRLTADPAAFVAGMNKAAQTAASASDQINAQFKKVGDAVNSMTKYMMGFTAVLAGGGALKKFITDANEWNGAAGKMASQLGISTEKASILNVALTRLGIDSDVYVGASQKLSKQIHSNAQAFDVLGVAVRDTTTGAYRPVTEVMDEVNKKLAEIKNPIEQNIAGQQVYGKGWAEVRAILKLTDAQMVESEKRARQLGLIVGPEGAAQSKQYSLQMKDLGLVSKALEVQFGQALLPVFIKTGQFMSEEGPAAGRVFATILEGIATAAAMTWLALKDTGDMLGALGAQAMALAHGDLAAVRAIGEERDRELAKNEAAFQKLQSNFGKALPTPKGEPSDKPTSGSSGPQYHFGKEGEDPQAKSRMSGWESALAEKKAAMVREGLAEDQLREMSKAAELAYWNELGRLPNKTRAEREGIARKAAEVEMAMIREAFDVKVATLNAEAAQFKTNTDERIRLEKEVQRHYAVGTKEYAESQKRIVEIERQATEQSNQIQLSKQGAERDARLAAIDLEEEAQQTSMQLGEITQSQLLAKQVGFEQQRYAISREALDQRLADAMDDPDRNPVLLQQIQSAQLQLEQQHQLKLAKLRGQIALDSASEMERIWEGLGSRMSSLWDQGVQAMMNGTFRWTSALRAIGTQVVGWLANDVVKPMVVKWIFGEEAKTAATMTGAAKRLLVEGAAAVKSVAIWAWSAAKNIMTSAYEAMAGAWKAIVGIPFVGPVLAPVAAGATFAGVAALVGHIASAEGGYDIPATINPMVQLHKSEMVLPAKHADVIRNLADNGGGAGSGGGGGGDVHVNVRGASVGDFLMLHKSELVKALQSARRDGHSFHY